MTGGSIVAVVAEAGSAAYLRPVIEAEPERWSVLATPTAATRLRSLPVRTLVIGGPEQLETIVAEHRPEVMVSSATGADIEAMALAQGRPTLQFVDVWYGFATRLRNRPSDVAPDRLLVLDERSAAAAAAAGIPSDRVHVVGQPAWEQVEPLPHAPAELAMFAGQPVERHYGPRLGFDEHTAWGAIVAAADARPDLLQRVVYAIHPASEGPPPSDGAAVSTTADAAAVLPQVGTVLGMFSALLVEARLAGRRAISVVPAATSAAASLLPDEAHVPCARDQDALIQHLTEAQPDPSDLREHLVGSADRVREAVDELCR